MKVKWKDEIERAAPVTTYWYFELLVHFRSRFSRLTATKEKDIIGFYITSKIPIWLV